MFAIIKKPARNWRTEIMRESHCGRQWFSRKAAGPASQVKIFSCGRLVQTAGQRSLVARGEPRLGGGGVCNTQETCTQLADRNHAMELSQTSVAGRKKRLRSVSNSVETNNTSHRTPAASPEFAPCQKTQGPSGGGEVQRAPRAGEASVSNHFQRASPILQRRQLFFGERPPPLGGLGQLEHVTSRRRSNSPTRRESPIGLANSCRARRLQSLVVLTRYDSLHCLDVVLGSLKASFGTIL